MIVQPLTQIRSGAPGEGSEKVAVTALQENTLRQLVGTLEKLADFEEQRRYKNAVPFVHIPIELAAQWENYPRLLDEERAWFVEMLVPDQIEAIRRFDNQFRRLEIGDAFPDVEEIFELPEWISLSKEAEATLHHFCHWNKLGERDAGGKRV